MRGQLSLIAGALANAPLQAGTPMVIPADNTKVCWLFTPANLSEERATQAAKSSPSRAANCPWSQPESGQHPAHIPTHIPAHLETPTYCRAMVIHVLAELYRRGQPARIIAENPTRSAWMCLDWEPSVTGLGLLHTSLDGSFERPAPVDTDRVSAPPDLGTDLSPLQRILADSVARYPQPALISCPGNGHANDLQALWPATPQLGSWVQARWQFAEAGQPVLGILGSWYRLLHLQKHWQQGALQGTAVLLEIDTSGMAGIAILDHSPDTCLDRAERQPPASGYGREFYTMSNG